MAVSLDIRIEEEHHPWMSGLSNRPANVSSVFGISRQLPQSYVPRGSQEDRLAAALSAGGHLVIWGEPRQGKSSLVRHQLKGIEHCIVQCAYGQRRLDIYRMILREAGASVAVERKRRRARGIGARVSILTGNLTNESETTERTFDIDISNINDVLRVIEDSAFNKVVVLEDFHYLGRPVQRQILQDMKAIYEKSDLKIILVGVWADRNQLLGLHVDLGGRVDGIEIPRWTEGELTGVLRKGENILGLHLGSSVIDKLIANAQQSVGVLQELALAACVEAERLRPTDHSGQVEITEEVVGRAVSHVLEQSVARLRWYISTFANPRKRRSGKAQPYKGIVHALLVAPKSAIRDGIHASKLFETMQNLYPFEVAELTYDDLLKGLNKLGSVHRAVQARPILEYDSVGERLHVVDPMVRLLLASIDTESLIRYLPDEGSDIETNQYHFGQAVKLRYGQGCAICPISDPSLIEIVRLARPPFGYATAAEYGLPICLNHAEAWRRDLLVFEPGTTKIVSRDPVAINIMRDDLTHLRAQPAREALEARWNRSASYYRRYFKGRGEVDQSSMQPSSGND
jgi:hypothetical protein